MLWHNSLGQIEPRTLFLSHPTLSCVPCLVCLFWEGSLCSISPLSSELRISDSSYGMMMVNRTPMSPAEAGLWRDYEIHVKAKPLVRCD